MMEDYYSNGSLKFKTITIIIGGKKSDFGLYGKTKTTTWEFYENGKRELVQKVVEKPAKTKQNKTTGEPMNRMPKIVRKYKRYDHVGNLTEKGWEKSRKSKNVVYNTELYRKVITKKNQEWRTPKIKYREALKATRHLQIDYMSKQKR